MRGWAWVAVLVVGLGLFELIRRVLAVTGNPNLVPSLILLGSAVVPAAFLTFVAGQRLTSGPPPLVIAGVAFVGGVVGVVASGLVEYDTLRALGVLPMVGVGLIEETAKLIAPLALLIATRQRYPASGLLLGVASGAGFAALETMGYGFVVLIRSGGNLAALDEVLLLRGVLSPAAHMAWTGLTAVALWYAAEHRFTGHALLRFFAVFVVAVALHTIWDSVGIVAGYAVLALFALGLLTVVAHRLSTGPASARPLAAGG